MINIRRGIWKDLQETRGAQGGALGASDSSHSHTQGHLGLPITEKNPDPIENHRSQRRGDPTAISYGGIAVITTTGVMGARGAPYPSAVLIGAYTQCNCALGFVRL